MWLNRPCFGVFISSTSIFCVTLLMFFGNFYSPNRNKNAIRFPCSSIAVSFPNSNMPISASLPSGTAVRHRSLCRLGLWGKKRKLLMPIFNFVIFNFQPKKSTSPSSATAGHVLQFFYLSFGARHVTLAGKGRQCREKDRYKFCALLPLGMRG